ncbi:MAG TPA: ATP-binding protein [Hyphomicrobiaceae bacterium]|nr:ATP-binding protein [Hyphomicrobiaceae bacterium]
MPRWKGLVTRESLVVIALSLALLAILTAAMAGVQSFADLGTVTIVYLIPVLFAATRGGAFPAIATALTGVGAAAFFFYEPLYDFRVHRPIHILDLVLFVIVAVVTGKLGTDARKARTREQADTLREALIGSVSHELRSPLSSIIGTASILARAPEVQTSERLVSLVQGMQEEADRLNDHIQNLLDSTRISSEGIRPHNEWVDPGDIVNAALNRKQRLLASHQLSVVIEDDLPMIHVDPALVERALEHLIENAVKYSPSGSRIEVRAERRESTVCLAVEDNGVGLSREERDRIWERFYRSPRLRERIGGSGLGLWIAQALVTACHGHAEVYSAGIGRGSTLSLLLPVLREGPVGRAWGE